MSRRTNIKSREGKGKKGRRRAPRPAAVTIVSLPPSLLVPREMHVTLCFAEQTSLNNAGLVTSNVRYNPVYAYDVDPALGTTTMPGYTTWSGVYRFYQLISSHIDIDFVNNESFGLQAWVNPVNYDPTANHVIATTKAMVAQPTCRKVMLGPLTGVSTARLSHTARTSGFAGGTPGTSLEFYTAPTSGASAPSNSWFWNVGIYSPSNLVNGVSAFVTIKSRYKFFETNTPTS